MRTKLRIAASTVSLALLVSACGGNGDDDTATTPESSSGSDAAPTETSGSGAPTTGSASPAPTAGGDDQDEIEVDDQSGDGSTVLIAKVRAAANGFVVITADDDLGTAFGSAPVTAGTNTGIEVPTSITESGEYDAVLYADDGDGAFDSAVDQPVTEDDDDDEGSDLESDDFDYRMG